MSVKNSRGVFQDRRSTRNSKVTVDPGPLSPSESEAAIYKGQFDNVRPQYYSDHSYTVWVYDLQVVKTEEVKIRLPNVSAALLFNLSGKAALFTSRSHRLKLEEKSYCALSLKPGSHILEVNPGYCKVLFLLFHPPYISKVIEESQLLAREVAILISETSQQLIGDLQLNSYGGELWRLRRQVSVLRLFFNSLDEMGIPLQNEQPSEQHPDYERMLKVQDYIKRSIDQKLSVQMLAKKFSIPYSQLRWTYLQVFKHHMWDYVRTERLHRATVLLIETEMPVHEIAWEVGYESATAFARVFTFHLRESPTDYRKNRKKSEKTHAREESRTSRK